jgi:hypothetical protein
MGKVKILGARTITLDNLERNIFTAYFMVGN